MRHRLPHVVQVAVGADAEYLEAAVGVDGGGDLAHPSTQPVPAAPRTGVWDGLPDVVKGVVAPDPEHLEPTVAVQRDRDLLDDAAEAVPPTPWPRVWRGL